MHRNVFFKKEKNNDTAYKYINIIKTLAFLNLSDSTWNMIKSHNCLNLQIAMDDEYF